MNMLKEFKAQHISQEKIEQQNGPEKTTYIQNFFPQGNMDITQQICNRKTL